MKSERYENSKREINKVLGQFGIDIRTSGQHQEMLAYMDLLFEEIKMTSAFLALDNYTDEK